MSVIGLTKEKKKLSGLHPVDLDNNMVPDMFNCIGMARNTFPTHRRALVPEVVHEILITTTWLSKMELL